MKKASFFTVAAVAALLAACGEYRKNDYEDNSPTSGKLKVYFDEGLETHVRNQVLTFESQYEHADIELRVSNDDEAVMALYNDSCKAIVISRLLNEKEKQLFSAREYTPKYTMVAYSGITLIANGNSPMLSLSKTALRDLLTTSPMVKDTSGKNIQTKVVIDRNNSSVMRYLIDSIMSGGNFAEHCSSSGTTYETLKYVASHQDAIGIVDFAWLSDRDDTIYKTLMKDLRILSVNESYNEETLPNQSTFKLRTYPLMRPVYVMRNAGEFTLAKGFESFVSGPKGQLIILKQGLLPARQQERQVEIKLEPGGGESQK